MQENRTIILDNAHSQLNGNLTKPRDVLSPSSDRKKAHLYCTDICHLTCTIQYMKSITNVYKYTKYIHIDNIQQCTENTHGSKDASLLC